jgi:hypothetical protein
VSAGALPRLAGAADPRGLLASPGVAGFGACAVNSGAVTRAIIEKAPPIVLTLRMKSRMCPPLKRT